MTRSQMPNTKMKKVLTRIARIFTKGRTFANVATEATQDFIFVANEFRRDGDWIMLSPYGDFPHEQGLQRLTRADAETLANDFQSFLNTPARMVGLPVFRGHPDHPKFRGQPGHTDTMAYGRLKKLEARPEGLFANVRWNEEGKKLVEGEAPPFSHVSVNWPMRKQADGAWHPIMIKSVGLTNNPNIPVMPIMAANERGDLTEGNKGNEAMRKIAKRLGLAEDATEEQIETAIGERETSLANERALAARAITDLANEREARQTAEQLAVEATKSTKAARAKTASVLIAAAVTAGKVLPAEKQQWEAEFANSTDFEAVVTKLESAKVKAKTTSHRTDNLGSRKSSDADRRQLIQDFVNERMEKHGEDYTSAYKTAMRTKPELFAQENAEAA